MPRAPAGDQEKRTCVGAPEEGGPGGGEADRDELRHSVGEYDESQWDQVHRTSLAELVSVREDLQAVEADIQKPRGARPPGP